MLAFFSCPANPELIDCGLSCSFPSAAAAACCITAALAHALLPGYNEAGVAPHERAFADAASTARLSAVLLRLLEADRADIAERLDAAELGSDSHRRLLLLQHHAPWLMKPWALDPVDAAHGATVGAKGAAGMWEHLAFPGVTIYGRRGMCGVEHCPRTMQRAASDAARDFVAAADWLDSEDDPIAGFGYNF
jgi:hypothetical protein